MLSITDLQNIASQVRRDIVRMVHHAASGHVGGPMGAADFLVALYYEIMRPDPSKFEMNGYGEDLFFLSNGHLSAGWYSVLARYGYFEISELASFRKLNSRLQGHPASCEGLPGVRISSGSLGQGLSVAIGAALAKKLNQDDHMVYCLMGDGELQEGQNWEAFMYAGAKGVDHLVAVVDYNKKQIEGPLQNVLDLGNLSEKLKAFGWMVAEMNGNNMKEVVDTLHSVKEISRKGKPVFILMHTLMGYGVDFMSDKHEWHGIPPDHEQLKKALDQLKETEGDY